MKKVIALIIALAMMLSLIACGSGKGAADEGAPAGSQPAASEPPAASEEASAPEEATDAPQGPDTDSWEEVNLTVAIAENETDFASECFQWVAAQVEERSNGKITFTPYYGGTYCSLPEQFDNVSTGAVDLTLWNQSMNADTLPFFAYSGAAAGNKESLDLNNTIVYENEITAPIFERIATEANVKLLGYIPAGYSLFCANKEITSLNDFGDITFGTGLNAKLWETLGFNVVATAPPDMYESLSRGVIDSACQALPSAIGKMFYEVTDYGLMAGYSSACYNFVMNLDSWNGLNDDQQALISQVMEELYDYSLGLYEQHETEWIDTWENETGNAIAYMSDEDVQRYLKVSYSMNYATFSEIAQGIGVSEDFEAITDVYSELLGFDVRTGE